MSGSPRVARIARLELFVSDLGRSSTFYRDTLGFDLLHADDGAVSLALGGRELRLLRGGDGLGPAPAQANSPGFQHFAVVVRDMDAAHARVAPLAGPAFSRGGSQQLPPRNGGVRAWKFRDPDGHPVELLETHTDEWRKVADEAQRRLFLGVDHTALACSNLDASRTFYEELGFHDGDPSYNYGPAQDGLDGLDGVYLRIATLYTPEPGPHIELLHYLKPPPPARSGEGSERFVATVLEVAAGTEDVARDPDGHIMRLTPGSLTQGDART